MRTMAFVLILGSVPAAANASSIVYQNTTTSVAGWVFNGAATIGGNLVANVDLNELTLAPGSAGDLITSLNFQEDNFNSVSVQARPTFYLWAANGVAGAPGTLLADVATSLTSFTPGTTELSVDLTGKGIIVPSSLQIWAGIGFDNDNGLSAITATQLNNLGAIAYHPATIGIDGPNAYFFLPTGGSLNNPSVNLFDSASTANYGWVVQAAPVPEPATLTLTALGLAGMVNRYRRRRAMRVETTA